MKPTCCSLCRPMKFTIKPINVSVVCDCVKILESSLEYFNFFTGSHVTCDVDVLLKCENERLNQADSWESKQSFVIE